MQNHFQKMLDGYQQFREKYADGDQSVMKYLSYYGQSPTTMVVACCDSRVDPALILQCDPGDLFVVRNVANIVPPYEIDESRHGTSAALEFGINFLKVKHLILLGHSQCGGIQALLSGTEANNDFITNWVSVVKTPECQKYDADDYAKIALQQSYQNCLSFPWIKEKIAADEMLIHLWFFDIKTGEIFTHSQDSNSYQPLSR